MTVSADLPSTGSNTPRLFPTTLPENRGGNRNVDVKLAKRRLIQDHITSFMCRASQDARRGAPGRKYLPCYLGVQKMHELYAEQNHHQVSYSLYNSTFMYDFNLAFGHPKKTSAANV